MEQYITALERVLASLSAQQNAGIILIIIIIAVERAIAAFTNYKRQQKDNKETDSFGIVLNRMDRMQTGYEEEIKRQREVNDKQRLILEGQLATAAHQATLAEKNLQAQTEFSRMLEEVRRMAQIDNDKIVNQIDSVGQELDKGVNIAQSNSDKLDAQGAQIQAVITAVNNVPTQTAEKVTSAVLEPLRVEFSTVATALHELTVSIREQSVKDREAIAAKIEALGLKMDAIAAKFEEIEAAVKAKEEPKPDNITVLKTNGEEPPAA